MYVAMDNETPERGERWEAQLRKGSLELAILAVLWNRRLYGLEILRHLKQASGLEVAEGTLYPILLRLKQDALLESNWVEAEAGHPRKYYWLTAAGRKRAAAMTQAWGEFTKSISRLTARVKEKDSP
jgi:PadR family transcriptional regulator, regulatory protein PadR